MAVVFFVMAAIAALFSAVRYQTVYYSLIDSFPLQFRDEPTSRYAFPVLALSPSTPLALQTDYKTALWAACACILCISLGLFAAQNMVFGCLCLPGFVWTVFSTVKAWTTYKENCK